MQAHHAPRLSSIMAAAAGMASRLRRPAALQQAPRFHHGPTHHSGMRHVAGEPTRPRLAAMTRNEAPSFPRPSAARKHSLHSLQADPTSSGALEAVALDSLHPAAVAHSRNTLGFGFSAGGLLFPYFIGVIAELHDMGVVTPSTPMAGASAGSLIVASYKSGVGMDQVFEACMELCHDLRQGGTRFRLGPCLKKQLEGLLPEDIHERCSGSSYVAVTTVLPAFKAQLVSHFHSKEDVIETLLTSCHIPWYLNGSVICKHRDTLAFDGGITNFLPVPVGVEHSVQVSCFPRKNSAFLSSASISPDAFDDWAHGFRDMLPWAFEPASDEQLRAFCERGRQDARSWCAAVGIDTTRAAQATAVVMPSVMQQGIVLPAAAKAEAV